MRKFDTKSILIALLLLFVCMLLFVVSTSRNDKAYSAEPINLENAISLDVEVKEIENSEGVGYVELKIMLKNKHNSSVCVVPRFNFSLNKNSEGFVIDYLSSPHGYFNGYELTVGEKIDLIVKVEKSVGFFNYRKSGQMVFPGESDKVFLVIGLAVADYEAGVADTITKREIVVESLVNGYFDSEELKRKLDESRSDAGNDVLPPLDLLPD